jgi:hypothetical protein
VWLPSAEVWARNLDHGRRLSAGRTALLYRNDGDAEEVQFHRLRYRVRIVAKSSLLKSSR